MMRIFTCMLLLISSVAFAAIDTYEFKDEASRERFQQLVAELRCPKCQNQNLADSNSPIASDLRREVYKMVETGESDEQIVDFMVARYGEFVLYRPRVTSNTWVLWYGPFALIALGAGVVWLLTRKRKSVQKKEDKSLSDIEKSKLNSLLNKEK